MGFNKSRIPVATTSRGTFNLGCVNHTTTDFGRIDVVNCVDVVPGDDIELNVQSILRAAPMPSPTFARVKLDVRHFFVPLRILCDVSASNKRFNILDYINGIPTNSHPFVSERSLSNWLRNHSIRVNQYDIKRLWSQLGLPPRIYTGLQYDSDNNLSYFKFLAYQRIWWDYYRDSNLIPDNEFWTRMYLAQSGVLSDNDILNRILIPRYACWNKDYFTTCRPYPTGPADETVMANVLNSDESNLPNYIYPDSNNLLADDRNIVHPDNQSSDTLGVPYSWIKAAEQLQKFLERNNLVGGRVIERMLARFGVSPDAKDLNLSEYLGGNSIPLYIGDITSNNSGVNDMSFNNAFGISSSLGDGAVVGRLSGKAGLDGNGGNIKFHAKEYGLLMSVSVLVPETGYFQGLDKSWTRGVNSRDEYFIPELQSIGYQPVYFKELLAKASGLDDNKVFGFQPRYSDYTYQKNIVSGDLVLYPTGMDTLHLFREFSNNLVPPANYDVDLGVDFTTITPAARLSLDRIFNIVGAEGELDHFQGIHVVKCKCQRNMDACALPHLKEDGNKNITVEVGGMRF